MSGRDDHISELVAPYVLGALEPDEVEQVELHLDHCPMCRELVESERTVVRALPWLAEPRPVPLRARKQLLARAQDDIAQEKRSRWKILLPSGRSGWIAASMAAVLAVVFAVNNFQMQGEMQKRDLEESEARASIAEIVKSPRGWTTNLVSNTPGAGGGIIVDPTTNAAIMVVDGLDQPQADHSYAVWMVSGDEYVHVGNLAVDDEGRGQLRITAQGTLTNYDGLMITEERDEVMVAGPSGDEIMAATFE
jgi:anti-sigma factor RsiW